jgi:hypothetical protein
LAYKTFDEQREVLSPAEQRFEKARQTTGLILGPIVLLVMLLVPLPLESNQQTLAAILAFTIVSATTQRPTASSIAGSTRERWPSSPRSFSSCCP